MSAQRNFPTTMGFFTPATGGYTYTSLSVTGGWMAFGFVVDVARTINKARFFVDLTGTLASGDVSVDVYSDVAGHPGSSLGTTSTFTGGTWPSDGWVEFTGLSVALTPGTQYWIVIKNNNATPATHYVQVRHGSSNSGPLTGCLSSQNTYGWTSQGTANSGSSWSSVGQYGGCFGIRIGFADGSYMGMPIGGTGSGNTYVYATYEQGVQFTMPPAGSLVVRGAAITLAAVNGTPNATGYVYKLYSGSTLLATSNTIPTASVKSLAGGAGFFAAEFPSPVTIAAGATVRLTLAAVGSTDGSTTGPQMYAYNWDGDSNSTPLLPMQGTYASVYTSNGGTSFTTVANVLYSFAILLDTDGETIASSGTPDPGVDNVRAGTVYGSNTGLLVVPGAQYVLNTQTFDYNATPGTATVPTASQVLSTVTGYGAGGTALAGNVVEASTGDVRHSTAYGPSSGLTGTCYVPTASQVLTGINVDAATGNVVLPTVGQVELGITFGPSSGSTGAYGAATTYTVNGPIAGYTGESLIYTVVPNGVATGTITPSDGGAGGTFTPTSLTWASSSVAKTFTYQNAVAGSVTLSSTNTASLSNPSNINLSLSVVSGLTLAQLQGELTTRGYTTTLAGNIATTNSTVTTNLNATVSSRSTFAGGAVASVTGAVGSVTSAVTVGGYGTGEDPATLVLGATAATWNTSATIGAKVNSGGSGGNVTTVAAGAITSASFASGAVAPANVTEWAGTAVATPNVAGVPLIDLAYVNGTATSTSSTVAANVTEWAGTAVGGAPNSTTPPTAAAIATAILATPANLLATNSSGAVILAPAGLDAIVVETGCNARQALSPILAASAGVLTGAGTATPVFKNPAGTATRITGTIDTSGNRTASVLNLPA